MVDDFGSDKEKSNENSFFVRFGCIITKEKVQNPVADLVLLFVVDLKMLQTEKSKRTTKNT